MMISSKGRYALRVMLDLAERDNGSYLRLKDIAERLGIPRKYLESIMTELSKNDLVESAIGKTGGYRLKRAPAEYNAGDILRAAEGQLVPVSCLSRDSKKCDGSDSCYTLPFWIGLEKHINSYIDNYTLKDILDHAKTIRETCCNREKKGNENEEQ